MNNSLFKSSLLISFCFCLLFRNSFCSDEENYDGPWRKSINGEDTCWMDSTCNRVMNVAHGGDWNIQYPYDSMPAFERGLEYGADAVKGDFRVSSDNIGVVMHSSPIEVYESINCAGKYVEKMTAEECQKCRMITSAYYFITVPTFLNWANGLINVMLCVKRYEDFPRAISTLIEYNATTRAFLEIKLGNFITLASSNTLNWNKVFYVIEIYSSDDVSNLLSLDKSILETVFLIEFNDWESWPDVQADIQRLKDVGLRTFAPSHSDAITATVANHLEIFNTGFDVAYTYNLTNAVIARKDVNEKRGISPARKLNN